MGGVEASDKVYYRILPAAELWGAESPPCLKGLRLPKVKFSTLPLKF